MENAWGNVTDSCHPAQTANGRGDQSKVILGGEEPDLIPEGAAQGQLDHLLTSRVFADLEHRKNALDDRGSQATVFDLGQRGRRIFAYRGLPVQKIFDQVLIFMGFGNGCDLHGIICGLNFSRSDVTFFRVAVEVTCSFFFVDWMLSFLVQIK